MAANTSLTKPLDVVQTIHTAAMADGKDYRSAVKAHFDVVARQLRDQIPDLNTVPIQQVPSGTLVRFRCMVQNMMGPEYYCTRYHARRAVCGPAGSAPAVETREFVAAYRDFVDASDGDWQIQPDESTMAEREVYVCVPPPGESSWMVQMNASSAHQQAPQAAAKNKRSLEDDDAAADDEHMRAPAPPTAGARTVRPKSGGVATAATAASASGNVADDMSKLHHPHKNTSSSPGCARSVMIKVADPDASIKIGQLIEFVGILETSAGYNEASGVEEMAALPSSMLPRLHAVTCCQLGNGFPAVQQALPQQNVAPARAALVDCLRSALGGDTLAAEYTLLLMMAGVARRVQGNMVGTVSLNLVTGPHLAKGTVAPALNHIAEQVLPRTMPCPLTVDILNKTTFAPVTDRETQQLRAGLLQLAPRTLVTIDETVMEEGKLVESGVKALRSVGQLVTQQQVAYEFEYSALNFDMDVLPMVLSQGKSIIDCSLVVRMEPNAPAATTDFTTAASNPQLAEQMTHWRHLAAQAHTAPPTLTPDMIKVIEDDYVAARQADRTVNESALHLWITLGQLLAASHGAASMEPGHWQQVRALESERARRLAA